VRLTEAGRRFLERSRSALRRDRLRRKGRSQRGARRRGVAADRRRVVAVGWLCSRIAGRLPRLSSSYRYGLRRRLHTRAYRADYGAPARYRLRHRDAPGVALRRPGAVASADLCGFASSACSRPRRRNDWEALKDEHFIVSRGAPGPEIHDYIIRRLADLGRSPSVQRYRVDRETLMVLVGLNFGVSLISEAGTATRYPDVVFRPLATSADILPYSGSGCRAMTIRRSVGFSAWLGPCRRAGRLRRGLSLIPDVSRFGKGSGRLR